MKTISRVLSVFCLVVAVFCFFAVFIWGCWWHLFSSLVLLFLHSAFADTAEKEVEE